MCAKRNYSGLDAFRFLAAFLVIAIHTSPLATINTHADFFLSDILARLAVPFFFMVTGQFVLSDYLFDCQKDTSKHSKIWGYLKKVTILYVVTILIYLPVGFYTERYEGITLRTALQMLIFDGTFYHLWYFPACITGVLIVYLLRRVLSIRGMMVITGILYLLGLLGDSYYDLMTNIPILSYAYEVGFQYFSYTRNGLFLAPFFLLMGAVIGNWKQTYQLHPAISGIGLAVSLWLLTLEAIALRNFHPKHHDNMYLFLVPCMFFLYQLLLRWEITLKSARYLRTLSTWIYILHPAMIVLVRTNARLLNITQILVNNRLIRYGAVCLLSIVISRKIIALMDKWKNSNFHFRHGKAWNRLNHSAS